MSLVRRVEAMFRCEGMISGPDLYEQMVRQWLRLNGARSRQVLYEGGYVHALEMDGTGSLPPLVLLHGFSASGPSQYPALIRALRPHVRRLLMPDLPGHGLSSVPPELDGRVLQRGLDACLDWLVDEPAMIFASSLSGGLSVRYALSRPEAVVGLMLCSPSGAPTSASEVRALQSLFDVRSHRQALNFVDSLFPERHPLRHLLAWGVRQQFDRPHLKELLAHLAEADFLRPEELAQLVMPVQLVWGQAERTLPATHFEYFRSHLPSDAEVVRPPGFGHAPFLHRSAELAQMLLGFSARAASSALTRRDFGDQRLVAEE